MMSSLPQGCYVLKRERAANYIEECEGAESGSAEKYMPCVHMSYDFYGIVRLKKS